MTKDFEYQRCSYAIHAPFPLSDREFYLEQLVKKDFPEPGMYTTVLINLAVDEDEFPVTPKRVRGILHNGMILKPVVDPETGEQHTEALLTNCTDINGLVPKWVVNTFSRSVPKVWFKSYEKGVMKYIEMTKK